MSNSLGLRPKAVAIILDKTENALVQDRRRGKGPTFVRDGKRIFYPEAALADYLRSLPRGNKPPAQK
jgi:hypothetical protein